MTSKKQTKMEKLENLMLRQKALEDVKKELEKAPNEHDYSHICYLHYKNILIGLLDIHKIIDKEIKKVNASFNRMVK